MATQAGKGSSPRNNFSKQFRSRYGDIKWTLGTKEDYENDVKEALAAYVSNKSSKNFEDLSAAESALKRHFPVTALNAK